MKECCKIGDLPPTPNWKRYLRWLLYALLIGISLFVASQSV